MTKHNEVVPYDEKNRKLFYKIVPVKDVNQVVFTWYIPYCENYYKNPLAYIRIILGHEAPNTLTSSLNKHNLCNALVSSLGRIVKLIKLFL